MSDRDEVLEALILQLERLADSFEAYMAIAYEYPANDGEVESC
jgi:hypothetical protein